MTKIPPIGRRAAVGLGLAGAATAAVPSRARAQVKEAKIAMLVPLFAWWFGISLEHALVLEIGLAMFFLLYTFVFNWAFDRVFGLPASAL